MNCMGLYQGHASLFPGFVCVLVILLFAHLSFWQHSWMATQKDPHLFSRIAN